ARLESPFRGHHRLVRRECALGPVRLRVGDQLLPSWAAATPAPGAFRGPPRAAPPPPDPPPPPGLGSGDPLLCRGPARPPRGPRRPRGAPRAHRADRARPGEGPSSPRPIGDGPSPRAPAPRI